METRTITDMLGRQVDVSTYPQRIISLVPSQTELLFDLGLTDEVVGITKFCIHPEEWFRTKKRVGGTKTVNLAAINALKPDLIIANKEENTQEQIELLTALYPTWISDIHTLGDALQMIGHVGELVGKQTEAATLDEKIKTGFQFLSTTATHHRVVYFIWRQPWMCAGGDTFICDIIKRIGWVNVLADIPRYPEVALEQLKDRNIDLVLLSSEPYPFKEKHIAEIKSVIPSAKVMLVDGEMFSWYGSRLQYAPQYLASIAT